MPSLFASYRCGDRAGGTEAIDELLRQAGLVGRPFVDDTPLAPPPLRALSLAIAQKCNLGCTYCYAQQGEFGGAAKNMELADALRAVDLLVGNRRARRPAQSGVSRRRAAGQSQGAARRDRAGCWNWPRVRGAKITFSITTNGTLLTEDDGRFFEQHGFAVTVSIDGPQEVHDAQRPFKGGAGSYDAIMKRVDAAAEDAARMQVSARVTVTPRNLSLRRTLDTFIAAGFHSVGFSPMLRARRLARAKCSRRISRSCWAK